MPRGLHAVHCHAFLVFDYYSREISSGQMAIKGHSRSFDRQRPMYVDSRLRLPEHGML